MKKTLQQSLASAANTTHTTLSNTSKLALTAVSVLTPGEQMTGTDDRKGVKRGLASQTHSYSHSSHKQARTHPHTTSSTTSLRADALSLFNTALHAVKPKRLTYQALQARKATSGIPTLSVKAVSAQPAAIEVDLSSIKRLVVVGAGKAVVEMAEAVENFFQTEILPIAPHLAKCLSGHVVTKYDHSKGHQLRVLTVSEAAHPVTDQNGVDATERILSLLQSTASEETLVLVLISGGGSALLEKPAPNLTLQHIQDTNKALLACGAPIQHINTVRKHLSAVKGGRLASLAYPSTVLSLVLSDVVGDDLGSIASGPTVGDSSTFQDCASLLRQYGLGALPVAGSRESMGAQEDSKQGSGKDGTQQTFGLSLPTPVLKHLQKGIQEQAMETPKPGSRYLSRASNYIVGSSKSALRAAEMAARERGYKPLVLSSRMQGEAREVAGGMVAIAREALEGSGWPVETPAAIMWGGETTVTLRGKGKGGRNQEQAVAAIGQLGDLPEERMRRCCILFGV